MAFKLPFRKPDNTLLSSGATTIMDDTPAVAAAPAKHRRCPASQSETRFETLATALGLVLAAFLMLLVLQIRGAQAARAMSMLPARCEPSRSRSPRRRSSRCRAARQLSRNSEAAATPLPASLRHSAPAARSTGAPCRRALPRWALSSRRWPPNGVPPTRTRNNCSPSKRISSPYRAVRIINDTNPRLLAASEQFAALRLQAGASASRGSRRQPRGHPHPAHRHQRQCPASRQHHRRGGPRAAGQDADTLREVLGQLKQSGLEAESRDKLVELDQAAQSSLNAVGGISPISSWWCRPNRPAAASSTIPASC